MSQHLSVALQGRQQLSVFVCNPRHAENTIVKNVDKTTIISQIANNNERLYSEEISNLLLNINKTGKLLTSETRRQNTHLCQPLSCITTLTKKKITTKNTEMIMHFTES